MKRISQPEAEKLNPREQSAFYNDVLKGVAQANRERREGLQSLENIRKAQSRKIMRPNL